MSEPNKPKEPIQYLRAVNESGPWPAKVAFFICRDADGARWRTLGPDLNSETKWERINDDDSNR